MINELDLGNGRVVEAIGVRGKSKAWSLKPKPFVEQLRGDVEKWLKLLV